MASRILLAVLLVATLTQVHAEDSNIRPPVAASDVRVLTRSEEILSTPSAWNRHDDRNCPPGAKTFSLYCALEKASREVRHTFNHRDAALQEVRFVIDPIATKRHYNHRLMDYNNDPRTTFADIHRVLQQARKNVKLRLAQQHH